MSTYYVSITGNNSNSGTSPQAPWQTLNYAIVRLVSGDTLLVFGGTYAEALFKIFPSGTSWSNTVRIAAVSGETVWLVPPAGSLNAVAFGSSSYVELDGVNIDGLNVLHDIFRINYGDGEYSHHIRYQNAELKGRHDSPNRAQGVLATGQLTGNDPPGTQVIGGNIFFNLLIHRIGKDRFDQAMYLQSPDNLVDRVEIYDHISGGVEVFNQAHGPSVCARAIVRNCSVHDSYTPGGSQAHRAILLAGDDGRAYNNRIWNIPAGTFGENNALWIYAGDRNALWFNSLYNCDNAIVVGYDYAVADSDVRNNIAYGNNQNYWNRFSTGTVHTNNIDDGTNPLWTSPAGADFTLQPTSPAIDAGVAIAGITTDINSFARDTPPDIGAYEFGSEAGSPGSPPGSPGELPGGSPAGSPTGSPQPGGQVLGVSIVTDFYSDHDMQCPASWYGGFKEGRVIRFGDGERTLSNMWTGDWQGATFDLEISDFDRKLRQQLASATHRYWTEPLTVRMTTRANRAVLGTPYVVFSGPVIGVQPMRPLGMRLTLGDTISQGLLADQHQIPWRMIRDSFVAAEMEEISDQLDLDAPEPIIYGIHRRIPDIDPASPQGFQYVPIYLGIENYGAGSPALGSPGDQFYVWMVCGHACGALPAVLVWTHTEDGGLESPPADVTTDADWFIPHSLGVPAYEDRRSATFGTMRRYTLIRARVGNVDAASVVAGEKTLAVFVEGVEPVGDGSGTVIQDRIQQYKHFMVNFVVNRGPDSYQAGNWLTTPNWTVFGGDVPVVDEASFDAASAIALERFPIPPWASPTPDYPPGYLGAAIIGARASDRASVRRWVSDWNRSCSVQMGISNQGQVRVFMLHPTAAIKAAAPLYTDVYEILEGSFEEEYLWQDTVNRVPWRADYEHSSGQWKSASVSSLDGALDLYGRELLSEVREYPFAPGIAMAGHLGYIEARIRMHPPKVIRFEATIGPEPVTGGSLGYRDLGEYIRYRHFAAIGGASEIRLAFITKHQVQAGRRRVLVEALDVEELIAFDQPTDYATLSGPRNDTCAAAIEIPPTDTTNYSLTLQTSGHDTDPSVDTSVLDGAPAAAHHAAWWQYDPPLAQYGHVTTGTSDYDTVLAVYRGSGCGDLELVASNDNDGIFATSFIEFAGALFFDPAYTYYVLAVGYQPTSAGSLVLTFYAEPLS